MLLSAKSWTWYNEDFLSENRDYSNSEMLGMWSSQTNSLIFICLVPKIEKVEKKTYPRIGEKRLVIIDETKVVGRSAWK